MSIPNTDDELQRIVRLREIGRDDIIMSLGYKDFYIRGFDNASSLINGQPVRVEDMTDEQLTAHRLELEEIIATAKGSYAKNDAESRKRRAKLTLEGKEWLKTNGNPNPLVSDAIEAVKVRKERMTKIDKLTASLKDMGIEDDFLSDIKARIKNKTNEEVKKMPAKFSFKKEPQPVPVETHSQTSEPAKPFKFNFGK